MTALDRELVRIFGREVASFSAAMRKLLVVAIQKGRAAEEARKLLQIEADKVARALGAAGKGWARTRIRESVSLGVKAAEGLKVLNSTTVFGGVNVRLLKRLTAATARDLVSASKGAERLLDHGFRRAQALRPGTLLSLDQPLTESLIRGTLRQEEPARFARRILSELGLNKGDKLRLENGQNWDARAYANLVARTRPAEALNAAKYDAVKRKGYEYIETSEHAGVRDDDICAVLQGKVWALDEDNDLNIPVLPKEWGLPPWHPNCRHTFGAWNPELRDDKEVVEAKSGHKGEKRELSKFS